MVRPLNVLLSDGSGVTGRQVAGLLHAAGHRVGVLAADPLALTRFTRSVARVHRVGRFGDRPVAWLQEALEVFVRHDYDVLLPTQEQVTALSWGADAGLLEEVPVAVPSFDSLRAVQDKASAERTLGRLDVPRPPTAVIERRATRDGIASMWDRFPAFAKRPVATASTGVELVASAGDLARLVELWTPDSPIVVQEAVDGPLAMVQSVWDAGEMVAFHANLRVREGVRGGAGNKVGVDLPGAHDAIHRLGTSLAWHGGLSADVIVTEDGPLVIDVNPRLVEPVNAARSGVDLVGAMLRASLRRPEERRSPEPDGTPGVATHQLLLNLLGAAQHGGSPHDARRAVADELRTCISGTGPYADSTEELTPPRHDLRTLVPVAVVAAATLSWPGSWRRFSSGNVANYAITPEGWSHLCATAPTS